MKVKMLTSMAGVGFALAPGDVYETTSAEGTRLIEAGFAEIYRGDKVKAERAVADPAGETTTATPGKAARKRQG